VRKRHLAKVLRKEAIGEKRAQKNNCVKCLHRDEVLVFPKVAGEIRHFQFLSAVFDQHEKKQHTCILFEVEGRNKLDENIAIRRLQAVFDETLQSEV
jgi:hypothetical protein